MLLPPGGQNKWKRPDILFCNISVNMNSSGRMSSLDYKSRPYSVLPSTGVHTTSCLARNSILRKDHAR